MEKIIELFVLLLPIVLVISYIYLYDSKKKVNTLVTNTKVSEKITSQDNEKEIDEFNDAIQNSSKSDNQINNILNKYI